VVILMVMAIICPSILAPQEGRRDPTELEACNQKKRATTLTNTASMPISFGLQLDVFKLLIIGLTISAIVVLTLKSRTSFAIASYEIIEREYKIKT